MHSMTAKNLKLGSVTFCFEVYVYTIINGGFVLSSAWDQAGLWDSNQKQVLEWSKVPAPVVRLDLGIDWPVSFLTNLTEAGAHLGQSLMAACPFRYHMHYRTS